MKRYFLTSLLGVLLFPQSVFSQETKTSTQLLVPFTIQAPEGDWSQPWHDACEEATMLMVEKYYTQNELNKEIAKKEILRIIETEQKVLGYDRDTKAADMEKIINDYLSYEATLKNNPSLEDIKAELDAARPVIALVHGKLLFNPNFKNGGPDYHVFVISGYDDNKKQFITQEPGTKNGKDYKYSYSILMNAIRDYVHPKNTVRGARRVIFTNATLNSSAETDADNDGLSKSLEIQLKTSLFSADTDGDGYKDGEEYTAGYSPTVNESLVKDGTLIQLEKSPRLFVLRSGKIHYVTSPEAIKKYKLSGKPIVVPEGFLKRYEYGEALQS